jgi:hypothetical protein
MLRAISVLFLALVLIGVAGGLVRTYREATAAPRPSAGPLAGELTGPAPWPANGADLRARLAALGLEALTEEGTTYHIHAHLDLFVDGERVTVPARIGIDPAGQFISDVHTHDATGVIHVESTQVQTFTLAEFFDVWGVRFGDGCLGGYCAGGGRSLRVYSNGRRVTRPEQLPLAPHQEIVVAFGTRRQLPRPIPASYAFPPGE